MASSTYPVLVNSDEERYQQISNLLDENAYYSRLAKANDKSMVPGVLPVLGYLGNVMMSLGTMWYNSRQQEKQNQYQEQLLDKQNQYNSPSAQLARLLHAGVPYNTAMQALVGSAVGNQTQPMAGQAAPYTPASPPSLQDSMALQAASDQHDLTQSQVKLNEADAYSKSPDSPQVQADIQLKTNQAILAGNQAEREKAMVGLTNAQREESIMNALLIGRQQNIAFWEGIRAFHDATTFKRYRESEIRSFAAAAHLDYAEADALLTKTAFEVQMLIKQTDMFQSTTKLNESQTKLVDAQEKYWSYEDTKGNSRASLEVRNLLIKNLADADNQNVEHFWNLPIHMWNNTQMNDFSKWCGFVQTMSRVQAHRSHTAKPYFPGLTIPIPRL